MTIEDITFDGIKSLDLATYHSQLYWRTTGGNVVNLTRQNNAMVQIVYIGGTWKKWAGTTSPTYRD
jgi:hypothetical protein